MKLANKRRSQRGVSLPMLAIVLGIGVLLAVAAIKYGGSFFVKSKVQNEVTALADFRSNVVSYGARVGMFTSSTADTAALIGQNFFPQSMVTGSTVQNQWGGSYTTAVGTIVNAGDSIQLTSTAIPAAACTDLGTSLDGLANIVSINGTQVKANGASSDPTAVSTACGGTYGDQNTLVLTVGK